MLTEAERDRLKAEEIFRAEVRREIRSKEESKRGAWLRHPASWVTLAGTAIAAGGFFLSQLDPGKLIVVMPHEIGLEAAVTPLDVRVYLPVTLANTAAPRITRHVISTSVIVREVSSPSTIAPTSTFLAYHELEFVEDTTGAFPDQARYSGRSLPFHVPGGTTVSKVLRFEATDARALPSDGLFDVTIVTETLEGPVVGSRRYGCTGLAPGTIRWCRAVPVTPS